MNQSEKDRGGLCISNHVLHSTTSDNELVTVSSFRYELSAIVFVFGMRLREEDVMARGLDAVFTTLSYNRLVALLP
jgi:hypothetical protein